MVATKRRKITDEFKREVVRLISTNDRTMAQVTADLGIGKSTLARRKTQLLEA